MRRTAGLSREAGRIAEDGLILRQDEAGIRLREENGTQKEAEPDRTETNETAGMQLREEIRTQEETDPDKAETTGETGKTLPVTV